MTIIKSPSEAEATGQVAQFYADDIEDQGYVASYTKVMSLNPEALMAFANLTRAIAGPMGQRRYELVTLAAALGAKSRHCRLAHGRNSLQFFDEQQLVRIAGGYRDAGLTQAEVVMMEFAEQVSGEAAEMTDADSQRLRDVGFSDAEIVDIALAAAARNYYGRALQALAVEVDVQTDLSESLRDALIAGI